MDVLEAVYSRRSVREFKQGEKIPNNILNKILDTARYAPSPENTQQWRFIISRDIELKKLIADISQERAKDMFGGQPFEIIQERIWWVTENLRLQTLERVIDGTLFRFPEKSDVLIFCCYTDSFHDNAFPDFLYSSGLSSLISLSMAIQNMWLASTSLGIGGGFMTIPFGDNRYAQLITELLAIPHSWQILTVFCLGIPIEKERIAPARFPLKGIVFNEQWGCPYHITNIMEEDNGKTKNLIEG